jgi:hypothetical protein
MSLSVFRDRGHVTFELGARRRHLGDYTTELKQRKPMVSRRNSECIQ